MKYQIVDNVSHYIIMDNTYCVFHLTITSRSMHVIIIIIVYVLAKPNYVG